MNLMAVDSTRYPRLASLNCEMCKSGLQVSKEGIGTYLKSQGYKSKAGSS